jgi:hypothetical protein
VAEIPLKMEWNGTVARKLECEISEKNVLTPE